jgi:hypothetical protein
MLGVRTWIGSRPHSENQFDNLGGSVGGQRIHTKLEPDELIVWGAKTQFRLQISLIRMVGQIFGTPHAGTRLGRPEPGDDWRATGAR